MDEPLVVAIDIGTSSVRALGFDGSSQVRFGAQRQLRTRHPHAGWSEQDPEAVFAATLDALSEAIAAAPARPAISAITFSAQMYSVLAIDGRGEPLTMSLPWTDTRAADEATALSHEAGAADLIATTGCPLQPIYPLSKVRWLQSHVDLTPDARFVSIKDYVVQRLTGSLTTDWSTASATGLLDVAERRWSDNAMRVANIGPEHLPQLEPPTAIMTTAAQPLRDLGLADTPIVVGGGDAPLSSIGCGAVAPDTIAVNVGTSAAARRFIAEPVVDATGRLWTYAVVDDLWVTGGIIGSAGSAYSWLVEMVLGEASTEAFDRAADMATTVEPGSSGVYFVPYFAGEQSPGWRPEERGRLVGLGLRHDASHLLRAALEGIAFALERVRVTIEEAGRPAIREVAVTGRVTSAPVMQQILADVLDLPIVVPEGHEGSARGAAILASHSLGMRPDIRSDIAAWRRVHPIPASRDRYRDAFDEFVRISSQSPKNLKE